MSQAEPTERVFSGNLRAAATFVGGTACLIVNDVLVKLAGSGLPIGQLIFVRGLFAILLVYAVCVVAGVHKQAARMSEPMVMGRAIVNMLAMFAYISALLNMPIANVSAIMQIVPLTLTVLAAILLKEKVGIRRWAAIAVGFFGVLLVVKPGAGGFNFYASIALIGVLLVTVRDLLTRMANSGIPSLLITLATAVAVTVGSGIVSMFEIWQPLDLMTIAMLAIAAAFLMAGIHLIVVATRTGELSVIAPFRYSFILWALLAGYFIWGEFPDNWAIAGIALITASGAYTLHRETLTRGKPRKPRFRHH
jgi:drug/metabolite transporter (DMT)-like permease